MIIARFVGRSLWSMQQKHLKQVIPPQTIIIGFAKHASMILGKNSNGDVYT